MSTPSVIFRWTPSQVLISSVEGEVRSQELLAMVALGGTWGSSISFPNKKPRDQPKQVPLAVETAVRLETRARRCLPEAELLHSPVSDGRIWHAAPGHVCGRGPTQI